MVKTTAPALSFGASGQIGKTMVHASWRGIKYARQHVIPANPNTTAQQTTRSGFTALSGFWKIAPSDLMTAWNVNAKGQPFTGRNSFIGKNLRLLRSATSLVDFIASPGALSGIPVAGVTATQTAGPDQISVTVTEATPPTDWTALNLYAVAFAQQTSLADLTGPIEAYSGAAGTDTFTITGLPADQANVVSVWPTYTRPDGSIGYGPSVTVIAAAAS